MIFQKNSKKCSFFSFLKEFCKFLLFAHSKITYFARVPSILPAFRFDTFSIPCAKPMENPMENVENSFVDMVFLQKMRTGRCLAPRVAKLRSKEICKRIFLPNIDHL